VLTDEPFFSLVDGASKLNLNTATVAMLQMLPRMTPELAAAIVDWKDSDDNVTPSGAESDTYSRLRPPYKCKNAPFETVDELRLLYGADMDVLLGEDANRNGVLDPNENDDNRDGQLEPGILDYVTVYSREPNFHSDGTQLTNVNTATQLDLQSFLQDYGVVSPATRAQQIYSSVHGDPPNIPPNPCAGILDFYLRCQTIGMSKEDFSKICNDVTTTSGPFVRGRVNVNTATSAATRITQPFEIITVAPSELRGRDGPGSAQTAFRSAPPRQARRRRAGGRWQFDSGEEGSEA